MRRDHRFDFSGHETMITNCNRNKERKRREGHWKKEMKRRKKAMMIGGRLKRMRRETDEEG